ncbi:isocitrate lyase/PEP mutase family protein [Micromonospora parathelypteridis]|uniref:2-methylisocitrate lyase-like PEP mutase family enzyme n=1 Tax=Micromonospora parathelypteridis TaxID=1839617 RepID=A0A840VY92_9ACTN|nr:isocitrate lyase/phosphoenolpyruvate mutase family protein [Micromonospora parathelypteridis]MBB5481725.1 2-methylisocitrate lyase-like PEP mutase family enzyme [Micromonospora parathelypteridis]GGO28493.1 phosphonomutase [Micromonospora parathelypteridis]
MTDQRAEFRALHHTGRPLLLPNAWDHASAAALAARGHRAIGTTSLGVAAAAGRPDGTGATAAETLALARRLSRLPVLLSVDVEAGFSADPAAVAEYVAELAGLGVVGINLEDGRADGTLADPEDTADKVAAVKAAVPDLFVNARTDTWWLGVDNPLPQTLARALAYRAAGADGIFVPGTVDLATLRVLTQEIDAPLNALYQPGGPGLGDLGRAGVARVSTGSLLFRAALAAAVAVADGVRASGLAAPDGPAVPAGLPSYAEVQGLVPTDGD